ncbi:MAG: hypothetical protein QME75_02705 [Deltaproteobacteria bacterium]|nr:hypothetical protein [Deltaproteobacteria bacterium]
MSKILDRYKFLAVVLVLISGLAPLSGVYADSLTPHEEARLYTLADLKPADYSPKTVIVEVYAVPIPEMQGFIGMLAPAWAEVQQFYARLGVNVIRTAGTARPGPVAPTEHFRVEALPHKEWLDRSCKAFKVPPPFRLSFMTVCRNKYAFAHLPLSVIHFSFKRFEEAVFTKGPGAGGLNQHILANLFIHELGHLMGLYHAHEFKNDPIEEMLPDGKTPNFMSHFLTYKGELGFVPLQKQIIHSYLSKGQVFEQYRRVDFDPVRYLELVKQYNGYMETAKGDKQEEY